MPLTEYTPKAFRTDALADIDRANEIIAEYEEQGFTLTLRQLFYQFVSRALIPNTEQSYKRLGSIINDARLAGLIDWDSIEDRLRQAEIPSAWEDPRHALRSYETAPP